ncbi:hypothetical protein [Catellatospora coxensis]|uniref:Uncharacterized protein n=1 Tax=Catellatospora coxensis TaxID=310354 RepID=A0A8J3PAL0_9ACTN|nr:hypothetical protein [Catellatospora coxensis]GIG10411.1 hypothetical protein Cco03nite_71110 [Catellatospora coxensis]
MRRLMVAALAVGTTLAVAGAAAPALAGDRAGGKVDCVVEQVDERGEVRGTSTEPEGAQVGEFRCVAGLWQFGWAPYEADDLITAPAVQVGPKGQVSVRRFHRPERGGDLTFGEMAEIARVITGGKAAVFQRAVVTVDDGRERTPAEVEAILAGKDTTGAKVLRTVDKLDPASTVQDVVDGAGGGEPVVVYLLSEIWDAITGAVSAVIDWVVDGIDGIGDWIHDHCTWFPPPPPGSDTIPIVTCQF